MRKKRSFVPDNAAMEQVCNILYSRETFMHAAAVIMQQHFLYDFAYACRRRAKRYERATYLLNNAIVNEQWVRCFAILRAVETMRGRGTSTGPGVMESVVLDGTMVGVKLIEHDNKLLLDKSFEYVSTSDGTIYVFLKGEEQHKCVEDWLHAEGVGHYFITASEAEHRITTWDDATLRAVPNWIGDPEQQWWHFFQ